MRIRTDQRGGISIQALLAGSLLLLAGACLVLWYSFRQSSEALDRAIGGKAILVLSCETAGATAVLDEQDLGRFPLEPLELAARETHYLKVEAPGYAPEIQQLALAPQEVRELAIALRPLGEEEAGGGSAPVALVRGGVLQDGAFDQVLEQYRDGRFRLARENAQIIRSSVQDLETQAQAQRLAARIGQMAGLWKKLKDKRRAETEWADLADRAIKLDARIDPQRPHTARLKKQRLEGLRMRGHHRLKRDKLGGAEADLRRCLAEAPDDDICAEGLKQLEPAAKRLYYKAYMARKRDAAGAAKMCREVIAVLPDGHKIRAKAEDLLGTLGSSS